MRFLLSACAAALTLGACATSGDSVERAAPMSSLPMWVASPNEVEGFNDTIVATGCARSTGSFSADKAAATATATAELARSANVRATAAIQDVLRRNEETETSDAGSGASRTTAGASTDQETVQAVELFSATNLTGLRTHNTDYVTMNGVQNLCAMLYIDESNKAQVQDRVEQELRRMGAFFDEDNLNETLFKADEQERLRSLIDVQ